MYLESTLRALWFGHPILQIVVAGVMLWRKLHRKFPVFFIYLLSQGVIFGVVFSAYRWGSYAEYFYGYWTCAIISLILGFKVIHEIFLDVFRPYHALKDLGSVLFKWAALVMLLVAVVVAAASPASSEGPLVESVLIVQRCVRVIQVGLVLFLLVFSNYVGVSWRQFSFGVSLGFGSFALVELLAVALHASGHVLANTTNLLNVLAYNMSILVWLTYTLVKSPAREAVNTLLASQRWDSSLGDIQHPGAPDSLIPVFESMVDRAFSRIETAPTVASEVEKTLEAKPGPERASSASMKP